MVVGGMVGSGIFLLTGYAAAPLQHGWLLLAAWFFGGMMALLGALSTAELASRFPYTGGDFIYLFHVYGKVPAFLYGWICLTVTGPGSVAILALFSAKYILAFMSVTNFEINSEIFTAGGIVLVLTILHCFKVTIGSRFQSLLTVFKVSGVALFSIYLVNMDVETEIIQNPETGNSWKGFSKALIPIFFAYSGWNCVGYIAGEVNNPNKTLPKAFIFGTILVTSLYVLLNTGFLNVMGIAAMQGEPLIPIKALETVSNSRAVMLVNLLILVSVFSSLSIIIQTSARILQSMGEKRVLFPKLAETHPKTNTPVFALTLQAFLAIVLMWILDIEKLVDSTTVVMVLFSAFVISALIKIKGFKLVEKMDTKFFRTPLYPVVPLAYILSALFITWGTIQYYIGLGSLLPLWGLFILLSGLPVYYLWKMKMEKS